MRRLFSQAIINSVDYVGGCKAYAHIFYREAGRLLPGYLVMGLYCCPSRNLSDVNHQAGIFHL